jgi:elongation factor 2 kinase
VFSAFSFYESQGNRLVADIQGVGNLFTDPQVLSSDYRFGDGDLGPRGMALFFKTFCHNTVASAMGIPVFPLSNNELKHQ